jgi:hypothetical protein
VQRKFATWLEDKDIFGFADVESNKTYAPKENDLPIQAFAVHSLMKTLLKKKLGEKIPHPKFDDEVTWGEKTGAVKIKLTPNGQINISRLISDLNGNNVWICKQSYKLNDDDFVGREDTVADDIFTHLTRLSSQPVDVAVKNYKNLGGLAKNTAKDIRETMPNLFTYEDIKEINPNNFIVYFSIRATGVGKIAAGGRRASVMSPYLDINMSYDNESGLIRVILCTTSIHSEGGEWEIDIPFFDEHFTPSQDAKELISCIRTSIKYY